MHFAQRRRGRKERHPIVRSENQYPFSRRDAETQGETEQKTRTTTIQGEGTAQAFGVNPMDSCFALLCGSAPLREISCYVLELSLSAALPSL